MKAGISRHSKLIPGALIAWLPCGPAAAQASGGTVVEYVDTDDFPNSPGGHFFYSSDPPEQAAVDAGAAGRFRRTGPTTTASPAASIPITAFPRPEMRSIR